MKYAFNDILNQEIYETGLCMFITGPYSVFNNLVADRFKESALSGDDIEIDMALVEDFGITDFKDAKINTSVDIDTFRDVIGSANMHGKWYCKVYWKELNKKQREYIQEYMKDPNENGLLMVVIEDYADYRFYLKHRILGNSKATHLIQLSFPNRRILTELVTEMFKFRGAQVSEEAAELFVMRMSASYDDYGTIMDRVLESFPNIVDKKSMEKALKGVDNYIIDDFVEQLLKPLSGPAVQKSRKIYKMYSALMKELGAKGIILKVKYRVDEYIEFRRAINNGIIPVVVRFSVTEAKERLGEESKLFKIPDFRFRRMAQIASQTSLKDWFYMKMLLSQVSQRSNPEECERILYTLVHRTALNEYRIKKGIGVDGDV